MIFQDPVSVLDPMAGIGTQLGRALAAAGVAKADRSRAAVDLLGSLHIPAAEEVARKYPHQLSGGMCQRVAIAMALAPNPDLLIADEPTTSLDVTTEVQVLDLLEEYLENSGASLILISHDLNVVKRLADSVTVMYAGQSVEHGPISDILSEPAHPYSRDLVRSSVLERGEPAYSIAGTLPSIEEITSTCPYCERCSEARSACSDTALGQDPSADGFVRCLFPLRQSSKRSVCKMIGHVLLAGDAPSLRSASSTYASGTPSSAGLARNADEVACHTISSQTDHSRGRGGVGMNHRKLPPGSHDGTGMDAGDVSDRLVLSVRGLSKIYTSKRLIGSAKGYQALSNVSFDLGAGEILGVVGESGCGKSTLGKVIAGVETTDVGHAEVGGHTLDLANGTRTRDQRRQVQFVYQSPRGSFNPARRVAAALRYNARLAREITGEPVDGALERAVTSVGLGTQHLDRYPHELSGGQLQRLSIGRALITRPDIVFLDEPTSSLDVSVRGEILNLLTGLRGSMGLSMILVSHDLDVISYVADRILVIYLGQIVEEGTSTDIVARPAHPYTRALLTASSLPDPAEPLELAVDVRDGIRHSDRVPSRSPLPARRSAVLGTPASSCIRWKISAVLEGRVGAPLGL